LEEPKAEAKLKEEVECLVPKAYEIAEKIAILQGCKLTNSKKKLRQKVREQLVNLAKTLMKTHKKEEEFGAGGSSSAFSFYGFIRNILGIYSRISIKG
jgi:hypothetical protein